MVRTLGACLVLGTAVLLWSGLAGGRAHDIAAQDASPPVGPEPAGPTPTPAPTQPASTFLLINTTIEELPEGPLVVNAATVILAPGASTQPFANPGPTILAIQEGRITLDAEAASVGNVLVTEMVGIRIETPPPGPVAGLVVNQNQQVLLPAGTRAEFRNEGTAAVRLLLLSFVPSTAAT
jgi:hypothetical protein